MGDRLRLPPARGLRWLGFITVVAALGTALAFALDAGPHTSTRWVGIAGFVIMIFGALFWLGLTLRRRSIVHAIAQMQAGDVLATWELPGEGRGRVVVGSKLALVGDAVVTWAVVTQKLGAVRYERDVNRIVVAAIANDGNAGIAFEAHVPGGDDPALVARCARLLAERHGIVCTGLEQPDSGPAHG